MNEHPSSHGRPGLRAVPAMPGQGPLPHDLDAERAVLAACILDPDTTLPLLDRLEPKHFYQKAHEVVFEAIRALDAAQSKIDLITVIAYLRTHDLLAEAGSADRVGSILQSEPVVENVGSYAEVIFAHWRTREMHTRSLVVANYFRQPVPDLERAVDRAVESLDEIRRASFVAPEQGHVRDALVRCFRDIEARAQGEQGEPPVPTGLPQIDALLDGGVWAQEMTVIAARPETGKTAFGLTLVLSCADAPVEQGGGGAIFFSLEATQEQAVKRLISIATGLPSGLLKRGTPTSDQWAQLTQTAPWLGSLPLWVEDARPLTVAQLRARARQIKRETERRGVPLRLIVVDYLTLLDPGPSTDKGRNREQEVASVSKALNALKKELNCAVVVLAQLNREVEGRKSSRPTKRDLRESGQVEQDADVIVFLHHPDKDQDPEAVEAWFDKNRGRASHVGVQLSVKKFTGQVMEA